jgi:poly-gamma-glutamate synthesis protein (capsule biosynthesis protein)
MTTLFLCGDVMTARGVDQILGRPGDPTLHEPHVKDARGYVRLAERKHGPIETPVDDSYVWGIALQAIEHCNPAARIVNLETAVTTSDEFWPDKRIHYRMSPENVGCLTAARLDCCTLANNHVLDWGYDGLRETLRSLRAAGLKPPGAGLTRAEAWAPAVLPNAEGRRILVLAVAMPTSGVPPAWAAGEERPGVAFLPDFGDEPAAQIAEAMAAAGRRDSDVAILSIHWGGNWGYDVPARQRAFAHRLIDEAGIDLLHAHSSHHAKGIEVYRNRLILYGCGDLITDYEGISGKETFRGDLGLLYFPRIDTATGRLEALHIRPTRLRQMQLRQPPEEDVAWMWNVLNREGRRLGTRVRLADEGTLELEWDR